MAVYGTFDDAWDRLNNACSPGMSENHSVCRPGRSTEASP